MLYCIYQNMCKKNYPDEHFFLEHAILPNPEAWKFTLFEPLPENVLTRDTALPRYWVRRAELGNEEILLLKNTFVEVNKVDMALEIADWFVQTVENVSEAHLRWLINYSTWDMRYEAKTENNEWLEINVTVDVEENRVVSSRIKSL